MRGRRGGPDSAAPGGTDRVRLCPWDPSTTMGRMDLGGRGGTPRPRSPRRLRRRSRQRLLDHVRRLRRTASQRRSLLDYDLASRREVLDCLVRLSDGSLTAVHVFAGSELDDVLAGCQHLDIEGVVVKRRTLAVPAGSPHGRVAQGEVPGVACRPRRAPHQEVALTYFGAMAPDRASVRGATRDARLVIARPMSVHGRSPDPWVRDSVRGLCFPSRSAADQVR